MNNDELENMAYEAFSGGHHVKGHMLMDLESDDDEDGVDHFDFNANESKEEGIDYMEHLLSLF